MPGLNKPWGSLCLIAACLASTSLPVAVRAAPADRTAVASTQPFKDATVNAPSPEDQTLIHQLLAQYTSSVNEGDAKRFESLLLDLNIPFSGVSKDFGASAGLASVQNYQGFKQALFGSANRYKQRHSNIKIEQVGLLAQVSLDYETALQQEPYSGKGWKVLHLLKVGGQWKIASEFYVGYPK
ncbi:nuclear transport factor 2 family protein [Roseateles chitinivorans]|uniref:nuclear transport factor 2 family protein n=1 Tax=Roseateles chitinivorans TaxID=2917965 RepID=UPI003D66ECCB